ncbi:hypothetical protein DC345_18495 [Paenibacillus taichungensis]|uniref:YetF C-terminal domain-containing protein n=1 Tax=Paenibacillus taichungensis TaxID=484184 RepID=A0A329QRL7_9BACL|nr:YetF domain-containing protein [Paenibacillus taichungensis]RAW13358.1 hypothetical protein DC345_18495 [Paenibacillus taichungensis]
MMIRSTYLNFYMYWQSEPPSAQDLGTRTHSDSFPITVIDKGEILKMSMKGEEIDADKVRFEMQKQGYDHIKDIAYAEYGEDGTRFISYRERERKTERSLEI